MVIRIVRAFERTRQIADFVPIKAYCEASTEYELGKIDAEHAAAEMAEISHRLDSFVQSEVDKTLMSYYPQCIVCGGKGQKMNLNKEGVCGQCVQTNMFKAREFQKESGQPKGRETNHQK